MLTYNEIMLILLRIGHHMKVSKSEQTEAGKIYYKDMYDLIDKLVLMAKTAR